VRPHEMELRQILDLTPQLVAVFGPDREHLYANRPALEYLGITLEEWQTIGDRSWFLHPDDRERIASVTGFDSDVVPHEFEGRIRGKDGTYRWFLIRDTPVRDERGRLARWYLSATDIEDRRRAEDELRSSRDALRRSEAYLAEAERLTHTGSWAFDLVSNKYVYVSEEGCRIFEIDPHGELPTREAVSRMIHPEDWPGVNARFEESLRERVDTSSEFRITTPKGTLKHVLAIRHPLLDDGGTLVQLVGTVIDITERKRAEEALRRSEDERRRAETEARSAGAELERVSRVTTMGALAASIAHEMNQPLAGLITSANAGLNWLAADPPDLPKAREALVRVVRDGTRAGDVVSRIREAVKRAPSGTQRLNVNEVVRDVLTLMGGEVQLRDVDVALVLDPAVPDILGDSLQLQQVVLNVLKNAIEAIANVEGRRGALWIQSAVSELAGKPAVLVDVRDNGAGFGVTDPEKLFDAFHTTKQEGMGMGLWISRWIVERHNGRLTAHPNDGPGATFRILLPAANGDAA
jgi:PAS domain S-box-containing protein